MDKEIERYELDEDKRLPLEDFKRSAEIREGYCFSVLNEYKELHSILVETIKQLYLSGFDKFQIRGILISEIEDVLYDLNEWVTEEHWNIKQEAIKQKEKKEDETVKNILTEFLDKQSIDRFINLLNSVRTEMCKDESPCIRCEKSKSPENCFGCHDIKEWKASRNKEE